MVADSSDRRRPDSDLPFGRKNTWRASLSFSQNLWSGGRNGAQISLAAAGHETAQLGLTTTRAQLLFEVTQAYYDAVLSEQLVNIAAATLEQAGATLRQVEAGLSAGTQPEFEVLRARVTRDQQQPVLIRQRVNRALAYLRLKRLLDLPPEADLQLANALEDENLPPSPSFVERVSVVENALRSNEAADLSITSGLSLPARVAVDQTRATVRTREASLNLIEAQKMPSVSLNSNYARIAYPENVAAPTFNRSNWSVGVSMSVPLLTGGRQRGDEQVARAELDQSLLQQRQMEELAALDTRSAWAELLASRVAWESTAGTVQQAESRVRDRRRPLWRRCLDAARVVGCAGAAPAGRGQSSGCGPRPSGVRARVSRCCRISRLEMPFRVPHRSSRNRRRRARFPCSPRHRTAGREMLPRNSHSHRQELDEYTVVPGNAS